MILQACIMVTVNEYAMVIVHAFILTIRNIPVRSQFYTHDLGRCIYCDWISFIYETEKSDRASFRLYGIDRSAAIETDVPEAVSALGYLHILGRDDSAVLHVVQLRLPSTTSGQQ